MKATDPRADEKAAAWVEALGGKKNIKEMSACAVTRLRVKVADVKLVDQEKVRAAGAEVMALSDNVFHLIVGPASEDLLRAMKRVA